MDEFSVCFTSPLCVDMLLFTEWLSGADDIDAAKVLSSSLQPCLGNMSTAVLLQEVKEQYVLFSYLQQYLFSPQLLKAPNFAALSPETKDKLVSSYYEFDKPVIREILGKKMNSKLRKDMDEVSEKTQVSLKSCQRQFDNIKNILKTFDDVEGNIKGVLTTLFHFSDILVKKYIPLIYVFIFRFETSKKRLQYLSYDDIIICTEHIIEQWTTDSTLSGDKLFDADDIDRSFFEDLRELRNLVLEKDFMDQHKSYLFARLERKLTFSHFAKGIDAVFRLVYRNLFTLGANLFQTKDFRNFFNDFVEKVTDPVKQANWTLKELDVFLTELLHSWGDIKDQSSMRRFDAVYLRYLEVARKCILQIYH
ncbi:acidic fibroblast growth factor intracellular-binding protein isoform X1 [Hydra vulgaris]|uniref:acidic fibroblast growth factor intracellular-binding protein isoform X1 n=1 Tax=Hydra vulgaris TaxID=6087 RepID=UPI001F5FD32A|nr:acidic fibroblast growth factor intracellular-binding protein isoform X1 [Hydra vulgaris]